MKVKLAAQLFSDSVSKALALAQTLNIDGFEDCYPTQHLCSVVNNLFDILNSKSVFGKEYKAPLSLSRLEQVKSFLVDTREMFLQMRTGTGKLVCTGRLLFECCWICLQHNLCTEIVRFSFAQGNWR